MNKSDSITSYSLKITLPYLVASALWILFSDRIVAGAASDIDTLTMLQTYKGWFFVTVSAFFIYLLSRRYLRELRETSTNLKESKEALSESQRVMTTLHANLPGFAYRCYDDPDWAMMFLSDGCEALTGYCPDELIDNICVSYADIIIPEDREMVSVAVELAVADRQPFQIEYRIRAREGQVKWVWEQGCGVFDKNGKLEALEGYISDISERKQLQEQLRASERLDHVGQAASTIIHDLKNPMQVILGHVELLRGKTNDQNAIRHLSMIETQVQNMLSMSRELLDYARGEISLSLDPVHVWELLQQLVDTYQPTFRQAGVGLSFTWRQEGDAVPMADLDRDRIWRALMNLVSNAKEAMKGDGQIRLRSWTTQDHVHIEVEDDGPGIPKNIESDVFSAFVTHGKSGGTGLGLAITKKIIESHQGTITFSSETGTGTTFTITLPRKKDAQPDKAAELAYAHAR